MLIRPQDAGCHRPAPSSDTLRLMAGRAQDRDHTEPRRQGSFSAWREDAGQLAARRKGLSCSLGRRPVSPGLPGGAVASGPRISPQAAHLRCPPTVEQDHGLFRSRPAFRPQALHATCHSNGLQGAPAPRVRAREGLVWWGGQRHTQGRGSPSNSPHVNFLLLPSPHVAYVSPYSSRVQAETGLEGLRSRAGSAPSRCSRRESVSWPFPASGGALVPWLVTLSHGGHPSDL